MTFVDTVAFRSEPELAKRAVSRAAPAFVAMLLIVVGVSVHDAYLVLLYEDVIETTERNPIGIFLIEINGGGVAALFAAKLIGTCVAGSLLMMLYEKKRELALVAAAGLACFQTLLLLYLHFASFSPHPQWPA
jgi:hypothetical protein